MILFLYLQFLDALTTFAFLSHGLSEGNPFVASAMDSIGVIPGLVAVKALAVLLAAACLSIGVSLPIRWANVMTAIVVAWNIFGLIAVGVQ